MHSLTSDVDLWPRCRPQRKLLHAAADARYRQGMHALHETHALADQVCRYDLDDVDVAWLDGYNDVCDSIGQ